jgi:DNA polymerase V
MNKELLVPLIESAVPAGFPSIAEDYVDRALNLNELLIKHPAATFFVRVKGDSMINAGIQSHDILIVDRALTPLNNKIVVARIDGELTVKRLRLEKEKVFLIADNPAFKPIEITPSMDFEVWGVVTCVIHQV